MATIDAIGYLRQDISCANQQWDETRMRSLAKRLGYNLRKTVAFSERTDDPVHRLILVVRNLGVDAVIVPGPEHFDGGEVPEALVLAAEVVTVEPEQTFTRWPYPPFIRPVTHGAGRM